MCGVILLGQAQMPLVMKTANLALRTHKSLESMYPMDSNLEQVILDHVQRWMRHQLISWMELLVPQMQDLYA